MSLLDASRRHPNWADNAIARVVGSLDRGAGETLRSRLTDIVNQGHRSVVIDVSDLAWVDAAGLHELRDALGDMRARSVRTYMRGATPPIVQAFEEAGALDGVVIL